MLCNFTFGSLLKLIVQKQPALYPFLTNDRNVTGNSVTLKPVICCFRLEHHYQKGLFRSNFLHILANKRVIYELELNL